MNEITLAESEQQKVFPEGDPNLEAKLAELQNQRTTNTGSINLQDNAQMHGTAVGVNLGTIQAFFGSSPPDEAKELLDAYLHSIIERCDRLRIADLVQRAKAQQASAFSLSQVYITLAADAWVPVEGVALAEEQTAFDQEIGQGNPDEVLPQAARQVVPVMDDGSPSIPDTPHYQLQRPVLLTEAICTQQRVSLLGGPGSGKSTFVRYVALALARALLSEEEPANTRFPGWSAGNLLPFLVSLGGFAAWTQQEQERKPINDKTLWEYLIATSGSGMLLGFDTQIRQAFRCGKVAVFLDGLDEVSDPLLREQVSQAAATLSEQHRGVVVLTCRTWSFTESVKKPLYDWGAPVQVAPFRFGQMQAFIRGWYTRSAEQGALDEREAKQQSNDLIKQLQSTLLASVRALGTSPLLLTVIVLLHYYEGRLPENRAELYENLVELLLKNWAQQRRGKMETPSLLEQLSIRGLKDYHIRSVLEKLAYRAHQGTQSANERGLLEEGIVRQAFLDLFTDFELQTGPANEKAQVVLDYLREESGLLVDEGGTPRQYALPHLTYEEYLAGSYLVKQKGGKPTYGTNSQEESTPRFEVLAYQHWQADPTRWREVIFLAVGQMLQGSDRDIAALWVRFLLEACHGERQRTMTERSRAAVFAAECVREVGGKKAFIGVESVNLSNLWQRLSDSLVEVLNDTTQPLPVQERIHAGFLLGDIGDPRFPVTVDEWKQEWEQAQSRSPESYFCPVAAGTYRIGGWDENEAYADIALQDFWIARYPVTVAQYAQFIADGGYQEQCWWTPLGMKWKANKNRLQPWGWDDYQYNNSNQHNNINQPVIGITWYEAVAFAAWMHEQLKDTLPRGYALRLPTEAEWEAAAAYNGPGEQHRTYPWGNTPEPMAEHVITKELELGRPAPVGCCPAGAAACGALDMVGNVWEWTTSSYPEYPSESGTVVMDFTSNKYDVAWRGDSFYAKRIKVSCASRGRIPAALGFIHNNSGLRLLISSYT